ncbi:DUF6973 domain-containing protein [Neisseria perflava]|uniref:DUF6973 domain-containing protein n=1 Tax=Neisseria perflava TaxID=33053 RepID=UPI0020A13198|nr:hypothetical protein [Neisseria perflava]MCP1660618.1 hypothetical protein [Neisseria perflava]MCP1772382.1 hypothetical protein [Neisseria perflava]
MKSIYCLLLSSLLLTACQSYQENQSRRSKMAQFVLNHPVAAQAIGAEDKKSTNISSNAKRLAARTGLDDTANGDGHATQVNAVRNTLWQAAIASQFDSEIAQKAGNAYLSDMEARHGKNSYYSRLAADQAVDLRNNHIGRSIGSGKPDADMKSLTQSVLFYYHKVGLWIATQVKEDGRSVWRISQNKLSKADYKRALKNLEPLNKDGMNANEEQQYKSGTLREIKKSVQAIGKVED